MTFMMETPGPCSLSLSHTHTHARRQAGTQARTHEGHPSKSKQAYLIKHCLKTHTGNLLGILVRDVGSGGKRGDSSAGRYDQKCISQYFSKLYRFHGIWRYFLFSVYDRVLTTFSTD